ncbi:MAG: hypothetical protein JF599_06485 [Verrucomicrobia bacterium]|nr:hypothetical protein [Verrucomicrobiota bacterium]
MPITPYVRSGVRDSRRGFALLITITLLSFLVLLLVSLASLTRVETQVASNSQQLAQARQNALLALNIALGQLQKYTGPDQRVTATADLANGATVANPRWVGVYGNSAAANYGQKPSAIAQSTPRLLNWLVSGNEAATFTWSQTTGSFGQITSSANSIYQTIARRPTDTVSGGLATATALSDLTLGSSATPAKLLVGPNTVDSNNATTDYVVAPLVNITVPASTISGLGTGTTPTTIGRYAFWVGDEGMKARVNLRDSYSTQSSSDQAAFQIYSFITAQRSAGEMVAYDYKSVTALSTDYPAPTNSSGFDKLQTLSQLAFAGSASSAQTNLRTAEKTRFHDLTAMNYGVIADVYAGGLKKDLTADIADTSSASTATRPADTDPLFTRENAADTVPTWGQLRSFPRINPVSGKVDPILPTTTSQGIYPVINYAGLGLDFYVDSAGKVKVALFPNVGLWNPYSTTIKAATYEIGYRVNPSGAIQIKIDGNTVATLDMALAQLSASTPAGSGGFVRFKIICQDIPPGETHLYRLDSSGVGTSYSPGGNTMTRAPAAGSGGPIGVANYVLWDSGVAVAPPVLPPGTETRKLQAISTLANPTLNVVLGTAGSVTSITSTTGWYQAAVDAVLSTGNPTTVKAPTSLGTMGAAYSVAASSAFRLQTTMEEHGNNDNGAQGAPKGALFVSSNAGGGGRMRWLATANIRSPVIRMTSGESANTRGSMLFGSVLATSSSGGTDITLMVTPYGFLSSIGASQWADSTYTPSILFDALSTPDRLLSLGQFQNAQLAPFGFYSTYPFGNAGADVHIQRDHTYEASPYVGSGVGTTAAQAIYDLSWHLNRALWDKYFVSGVPSKTSATSASPAIPAWTQADIDAGRALPNARLSYYARNGVNPTLADIQFSSGTNKAYDRAAADLMVKGAFNINSTSEQAWRAVLASTNQIATSTAYADSTDGVGALAVVPRISANLSQSGGNLPKAADKTLITTRNYLGNRGLSLSTPTSSAPLASIVNELARTIVAEIRARGANRGPSLSVAEFVNRRISSDDYGIRGTLQAAIDNMASGTAEVNASSWGSGGTGVAVADKPVTAWITEHYLGGPLSSVDSAAGGTASGSAIKESFRARVALCPKYLTQADLLSLLGPIVSARSDTFLIRTYGEVKNPVTGGITGRAWCEATVQRLPDYMDTTDSAETAPGALTIALNKTMGRRFQVVSFRWLSPSDI